MATPSPLKAAAAMHGISLAQLARDAGYEPRSLYLVARGSVAPWPEFRRRIAEVLGEDPFDAEVSR